VQTDLESEQIDRIFAAKLQDAMGKTAPIQALALREKARGAPEGWAGSACALLIALLIVTLYASVVFHWGGPGVTLLLVSLPAGLWLAARTMPASPPPPSPGRFRRRGVSRKNLRRAAAQSVLPHVLSDSMLTGSDTLSRAERLYGGVVIALSQAGGLQGGLLESVQGRSRRSVASTDVLERKSLLSQCNSLMRSFRRLEAQRRRLDTLLAPPGIAHAVAEHADLSQRCLEETDPVAHESLSASAAYCAERIDNLRALQSFQTRILAHQEMICQAFALARTALVRADIGDSISAARALDTTALVTAAQELSRRMQSLEEALAEVGEIATFEL
jgi:hypothetical protein